MKQFALMGAKPEQIFALLDIKGIDDITLDHLVTLRGLYNAIREGETTVERAFAPKETEDKNLAAKTAQNLEDIKEKYKLDPQRAEQLRAEAERQKKAVAEKYGASQPAEPPSGNGDVAKPVAAEADKPPAPPNEEQQPGDTSSHAQAADAAGETGTPAVPEQHGIAGIFDEPARGKKGKR